MTETTITLARLRKRQAGLLLTCRVAYFMDGAGHQPARPVYAQHEKEG
jgi:hypothetical protein